MIGVARDTWTREGVLSLVRVVETRAAVAPPDDTVI
jgi:hypothetical protein